MKLSTLTRLLVTILQHFDHTSNLADLKYCTFVQQATLKLVGCRVVQVKQLGTTHKLKVGVGMISMPTRALKHMCK